MQWSDKAIILSMRRLGENSGVIHLLTPEHGMHAGVDKGAFGKRKRGLYQPGNIVAAHWNARLAEHLGMLSCELTQAVAAHLLDDRLKLAALSSAVLMAEKMLAEREAQPVAFAALHALIQCLVNGGDWLADYVRLEYTLLACTGYGLDLERCAATGQEHDLLYVSPRSGRAVSRHAGEPYRERLFRLPAFLSDAAVASSSEIDRGQILDGLKLCAHFIDIRAFAPRGMPLPAARSRFVGMLHAPVLQAGDRIEA